MSALSSFGKLLAALVAAGVAIALCLAPLAGLGGMAIARTDETMQSNPVSYTHLTLPTTERV